MNRGPSRRTAYAACAVALAGLLSVEESARASIGDVFGLGSEESALASASAARVSDFSSAHYDPAGLTRLERPEATVGVVGQGSLLTITTGDGRRRGYDLTDPFGIVIGAAAPVPFGGALANRIYVGVALYLLPDSVVRVINRSPEEPFFPYYDDRTQRLVVLPTIAARLGGGLSLGVAANYLAGLAGKIQAGEGATRAVEPRVDEQIGATLGVNVGLRWQSPRDRLAFALVYRSAFSVPFTTTSVNRVAGQPIDIDVAAEGLYTPHELVVGGAARPLAWLRLSLDLQLSLWSAWRGPYVAVSSQLPLAGTLAASPPILHYDDTVALRLGAEATRAISTKIELRLRLGLGGETSPIPADQPGVTNQLDGEKLFCAVGAGLRAHVGAVVVRLDAHALLHVVAERTLVKQVGASTDPARSLHDELPDDPKKPETLGTQISNPGWPRITGGGAVWSAGLTLTVER